MLAGGGTTCDAMAPAPDLAIEPPPDTVGGGGTGLARKSPVAVLPQLLRSRLTCDGGGATTAGAGSVSLGVDETSRGGAETGGAITSAVCVSGTRELAKSRGASVGDGATTVCANGLAVRILSRETFGAGGMTAELNVGEVRVLARETSGAGGIIFVDKLFEGEQVGDGGIGMRQIYFRSVDNLLGGLVATRYADGLGAMVSLLAAGASGLACLRATAVLSLRQFVAGVIDHVPLRTSGRKRDLKTRKALGEHDDSNQQQALEQPAKEHAAIGEHADGRFSGQGFWRASERWAQGGGELVPAGRPFHQQARGLGPLGHSFRN